MEPRDQQPTPRALQRAAQPKQPMRSAPSGDRPPMPSPTSPQRPTTHWWPRAPILLGAVTGFGLCLLALLLYQALARVRPSLPDPMPSAHAICSALQTQDYSALYGQLSARLRAEGTAVQFAASQRRLDIQRGQVTRCDASIQHISDADAAVSLTLGRGTVVAQTASVTLIYESGGWKLDAYDPALVWGVRTTAA